MVGNLAWLLGHSVGLGIAEALSRYRGRAGEARLLNVKTSMYLQVPNGAGRAEL